MPQTVACATLVTHPMRFVVNELRGGERLCRYHLRDSQRTFCIHHGTADLGVLDEIFRLQYYALPAPVAASLDRRRELRVLDLGAHIGLFGLWILQHAPGARIVAFEPDALNLRALRCTVRDNALGDGWRIVPAAAATRAASLRFEGGRFSGSRVVEDAYSAPGRTVPALDVFAHLDGVDLLKMDMEGGEWEVLEDPRFGWARPPVIVLEYHPHLCPVPDARVHVEGILTRHGYVLDEIFASTSGVGMLWARLP
ncbi:MAG: FkbM family methyltransferase [Chloroflexi bacterium]|nr:FkbM family methyltransferase [Chloroflexota bacterium]